MPKPGVPKAETDFLKRLKAVAKRRELWVENNPRKTASGIARATNIAYNTIKNWIDGYYLPRVDSLKPLAEGLEVSLDELLGVDVPRQGMIIMPDGDGRTYANKRDMLLRSAKKEIWLQFTTGYTIRHEGNVEKVLTEAFSAQEGRNMKIRVLLCAPYLYERDDKGQLKRDGTGNPVPRRTNEGEKIPSPAAWCIMQRRSDEKTIEAVASTISGTVSMFQRIANNVDQFRQENLHIKLIPYFPDAALYLIDPSENDATAFMLLSNFNRNPIMAPVIMAVKNGNGAIYEFFQDYYLQMWEWAEAVEINPATFST